MSSSSLVRAIGLLLCTGIEPGFAQVPCQEYPPGLVPFAVIRYVTVPLANGDRLVVGSLPMPDGLQALNVIPQRGAPNQTFCGRVQLGPGHSYDSIYVPTDQERLGDHSAFSGLLRDPDTNQPFAAGRIPLSRLGGVYAWRVPRQPRPVIAQGGVINATGDLSSPVASPASLISIYGSNLAQFSQAAGFDASGRLPVSLAGSVVSVGGLAASLLYVSQGQINAQVSSALTPGDHPVSIASVDGTSLSTVITVRAASPGIFVIVKLPEYSIVSASNPARPGDVLVIYLTGLGVVSPVVASGQAAPAAPVSSSVIVPEVLIDGRVVSIANSVLAPGFAGLYQIGLLLASDVAAGRRSLVVRSSGIASPAFELVVAGPPVP